MTEPPLKLFLCGDVMTGRGIDQILPHPSKAVLYESFVRDAGDYVRLAEEASGPIPRPVDFSYIWNGALDELARFSPDLRIINLETSITVSGDYCRHKPVLYRMHPENAACLTSARVDCCVLANNHVLDWGRAGLDETLRTLGALKIRCAGAGRTLAEARAPAILDVPRKNARVVVLALGSTCSGIPADWAATASRSGVNVVEELTREDIKPIKAEIERVRRERDIVIVSIHWGSNWGYEVPAEQIEFAHALIDEAGADVVHGHSSHHVKGVEVYKDRPILYGCGDFLTDYEGIGGHESFRGGLGLMYFLEIDIGSRRLTSLEMFPTRMMHFQIARASGRDSDWLAAVMTREGVRFKTAVDRAPGGRLRLRRASAVPGKAIHG